MGRAFSSLLGYIRRWTEVFRLRIFYPIENIEEDVDFGKDENKNDIPVEDCPDGSDLQLDENREEDVVLRGEPKPSTAIKGAHNVEVNSASYVVAGDNNRIILPLPEPVQNLRIAKAAGDVALVLPKDVDEQAQISSQTVFEKTTEYNPFIMTIGEGNVIYLVQEGDVRLDNASNPEQGALRRLFPLQSELLVLPSPGVEPQIKIVLDFMCGIVDQLYPLRDGGKWQAFEKALNRLHSSYSVHPAIKCFLLLEESVKLTYQKSFKEAKRKAKASLKIVNNEGNLISGTLQDVLRVLANVALASIFRRIPKRKLGKAFGRLEDAMESSERLRSVNLTMARFALALLNYEQARCHMEFGKVVSDSSSCSKEAACRCLGLCIERCRALSYENQLYTAKQIFALIYMARLSLPAGHSEPGQSKTAKKQCARQAEKHLEEYERSHSHLGDYPVAARVKYLIMRSELCVLKRKYGSAKDFGCQALKIAVEYGFELETAPAQNHVEQISRYWSSKIKQDKLQRMKHLSSSCSSSTTTDSDQR